MNYSAKEIVDGYDKLEKQRDCIARFLRILTQAVEYTNSPSCAFRTSQLGYQWDIEYKNTEKGKIWSIKCSRRNEECLSMVFLFETGTIPDHHVSGMFLTLDELLAMFTSYFPKIIPRIETLGYASTIKI